MRHGCVNLGAVHHRNLDFLYATAERRGGVVSRAEAHDAGFDDRAIRVRIRSGAWRAAGRGLVVLEKSTPGDLQTAWTLQVNLSAAAVISGPLAARLGGWHLPGTELIALDTSKRPAGIPDVRLLRRAHPPAFREKGGLRLAPREEALLDTLICVTSSRAQHVIDLALQQRWVTPNGFDHLLATRGGRGRTGVTKLRALRDRAVSGSRSEAEQRMGRLLKRSRTGQWIANFPLVDEAGDIVAEIDFADPHLRIAIEVDGRAYHSDRKSFERDRVRQNLLIVEGWIVLRFTWEQIINDPEGVIRTIRAAIARAKTTHEHSRGIRGRYSP